MVRCERTLRKMHPNINGVHCILMKYQKNKLLYSDQYGVDHAAEGVGLGVGVVAFAG